MKRRLLTRLERLEVLARPVRQVILQYGWLKKLPSDYRGDRHVVMVKSQRTREGLEWVEAEEVVGPSLI